MGEHGREHQRVMEWRHRFRREHDTGNVCFVRTQFDPMTVTALQSEVRSRQLDERRVR